MGVGNVLVSSLSGLLLETWRQIYPVSSPAHPGGGLVPAMGAKELWHFSLGVAFGLGTGPTGPVRYAMVAEFFGTKSLGTITGLVASAWGIGGIAGPVLAGYVFDISHSYNIAFHWGAVMMAGMVATYFLRAPREKLKPENQPQTLISSSEMMEIIYSTRQPLNNRHGFIDIYGITHAFHTGSRTS